MRRFFRTTYSLAVIVLFLTVALLGFTQTRVFRSTLRSYLIESVNTRLHGELTLGSLHGNLFTGFWLDTVVLRQNGEPVLVVDRLDARYDPLGVLTKSAAVSRLTLTNPVIYLTRARSGDWNVTRLLRPSSPADSTSSSWTINLKQLQIKGGRVRVVDSVALSRRELDSSLHIWPGRFDYANLELDSLDLDAGVTIQSRQIGLTLRSLSFRSTEPQFQLKELAGDFLLGPSEAVVKKLNLVTGKSHLRLDARMDSIDVTKISDLAKLQFTPLSARLDVERLDFGELKQFIGSPVKFLEQEVSFQLDVEGRFGMIDVRDATLHAGSTVVRIAGTVANLHSPGDLELDLACARNRVDPGDARRLMPTLGIPDLSRLGLVDCDLRFVGRPTVFAVKLSSNSNIGAIDVDGHLDVRGSSLVYDGTIKTARLNLAPLAGDSALASSLRTTISLQGKGTRLSDMTSIARVEIDSSQFYGLPVSRSVIVVDIADRTIHPRLSLRMGSSRIDLGGALQLRPGDLVDCDVSGRINSLDLSELTKKKEHQSDISFDVQARGQIKTLNALAGDLTFNFFRSSFDTAQFAGGPASIHVNTLDSDPQTLKIASDALDLDVRGHFTPTTLASAVSRGAMLVEEAIRYRITSLDSLRSAATSQQPGREFQSDIVAKKDSTGYEFTLNIKDWYPIGIVLGRSLEGDLTASGHVKEDPGGIQFDGTADAQELRYMDKGIRIAVEGCSLSYAIDELSQAHLLQSMGLSVGVAAKRFDIAGLQTENLAVNLKMRGDSAAFQIGALLDSLVAVQVRGSALYSNRLVSLNLDRLQGDFKSYVFENAEPVRLRVGRDGLQIVNLSLRHDAEELDASGYFDPAGISDVTVAMQNFSVENLRKVVQRATMGESPSTMSGSLNATTTFRGSFEEPRFSTEIHASGVRYEEQSFGQVQVRLSYAEKLLNIFAQFRSRPDSTSIAPELLVNGTVPYNLSLRGRPDQNLEGEMNLDVHSNDFRLEFLDPFIPELSNLTGLMICDMKLRGTVESPSYEGSLALKNARFLFDPLGIRYIVDGELVPNGRHIVLKDVTIRNLPEDRSDGKVDLSGSFSLEAPKIKDFDLAAHGQLLLMKEAARQSSQGLYGDLFAGTGPDGVEWKGSPSRSFVSGGVYVKYSNLTLPPTRQTQDLPNSRIDVRVIDDRNPGGKLTGVVDRQGGSAAKSTGATLRANKSLTAVQDVLQPPTKSFLDNIVYNLSVETQGTTQLRFIFSNFTNEQLLAELKGKTTFTKDGDQMRLTGELELGNRSFYNNFKKLDATGKVKFTGDPLNPELDITATYEGVHRGLDTSTTMTGGARLGGGSEKVVVKVFITGTREQPKVKMGLERYDQLGNLLPERPDVEGDAIAFLVTGSFRDELTQQDKLSLAGSNVLGGVASSILSGPLTDLLRKEFGIVRSVDVLYYGGGSLQESADVRLTGALGDAVFRLGGRVLSDLNNTNISIQLPMSSVLGSEKWRNLLLEAERTVEGVETVDQRRESRGLRLLYRIIF